MKNGNFLLLLGLLVFCWSTGFAQKKNIDQSYEGIKKIELNVASGDLTVKKSNSETTQVIGEYDDSEVDVDIKVNNGKLSIKEKSRKNRTSNRSNWVFIVPENISVTGNAGSGDFKVADIGLEIHFNTGSGDFHFDNVGGNVNINTGSGNINIEASEADFGCNTGSGNIDVEGSKGKFTLNTGSGQVYLQKVGGSISANTGSGKVEGKEIAVTGHSGFNSGSGRVSLSLSSPPAADFSVNAGSGNTHLDFNGQAFDGVLIMQCNKKNGSIAAPFAFDTEDVISKGNGRNEIIRKIKKFGNSEVKIQVSTGSGQAKVSDL